MIAYYLQRFLALVGINAWWLGAPRRPDRRAGQYIHLSAKLHRMRQLPWTRGRARQMAAIKRKMNSIYGKL